MNNELRENIKYIKSIYNDFSNHRSIEYNTVYDCLDCILNDIPYNMYFDQIGYNQNILSFAYSLIISYDVNIRYFKDILDNIEKYDKEDIIKTIDCMNYYGINDELLLYFIKKFPDPNIGKIFFAGLLRSKKMLNNNTFSSLIETINVNDSLYRNGEGSEETYCLLLLEDCDKLGYLPLIKNLNINSIVTINYGSETHTQIGHFIQYYLKNENIEIKGSLGSLGTKLNFTLKHSTHFNLENLSIEVKKSKKNLIKIDKEYIYRYFKKTFVRSSKGGKMPNILQKYLIKKIK